MDELALNTEVVAALMRGLGIDSKSDMARRTGIERTYLSRILRGQRPAQPSQVNSIARALKVSPIAVIGPSDPDAVAALLAEQAAEAA